MESSINIHSYSADCVDLLWDGSEHKIRKVCKSNSDKFNSAIHKQKMFQSRMYGSLNISAVSIDTASEDEENQPYFIMPYINGLVAHSLIEHCDYYKVKNLRNGLKMFVESQVIEGEQEEFPFDCFESKLNQIELLNAHEIIDPYFKEAKSVIKKAYRKTSLKGTCHGDLTLTNMILNGDHQLFLIDFLPTFYESPFQDLAKILQDRRYGWTSRFFDYDRMIRAKIFTEEVLPDPYDIVDDEFVLTLRAYELMSLLRIAPYISDNVTLTWLVAALDKFFIKD